MKFLENGKQTTKDNNKREKEIDKKYQQSNHIINTRQW
jgi:hypothetical protein